MSTTTLSTILTQGVADLSSVFATIIPAVLPYAIILAVLFAAIAWVTHSAHRRTGRR